VDADDSDVEVNNDDDRSLRLAFQKSKFNLMIEFGEPLFDGLQCVICYVTVCMTVAACLVSWSRDQLNLSATCRLWNIYFYAAVFSFLCKNINKYLLCVNLLVYIACPPLLFSCFS